MITINYPSFHRSVIFLPWNWDLKKKKVNLSVMRFFPTSAHFYDLAAFRGQHFDSNHEVGQWISTSTPVHTHKKQCVKTGAKKSVAHFKETHFLAKTHELHLILFDVPCLPFQFVKQASSARSKRHNTIF